MSAVATTSSELAAVFALPVPLMRKRLHGMGIGGSDAAGFVDPYMLELRKTVIGLAIDAPAGPPTSWAEFLLRLNYPRLRQLWVERPNAAPLLDAITHGHPVAAVLAVCAEFSNLHTAWMETDPADHHALVTR